MDAATTPLSPPPPRRPRSAWRIARRVVRVPASVLLGLLAVIVLALGLPPARGWLLRTGLGIADGSLPGELTWRRAAWPGLGRFEVDDLLWVTGEDTLATVAHARLQFRVAPLLSREVVVDSLHVGGVFCDLAGVRAVMLDTTTAPADTEKTRTLPRAALHSLVLREVRLITPAGAELRVPDLAGALELRPEHGPAGSLALRVAYADAFAAAWRAHGTWEDGLVITFSPLKVVRGEAPPEPASLPLGGRLHLPRASLAALQAGGRWAPLDLSGFEIDGPLVTASLEAHLESPDSGRVDIEVSLVRPPADLAADLANLAPDSLRARIGWLLGEGWPARDPHLALHAVVRPPADGRTVTAARITGEATFVLPGPADLGVLLPDTLQTSDLGAIAGRIAGEYDGRVQPPSYRVDLDLGETQWLTAGRLRAHGQGRAVVVDDLALAMRGLSLTASGSYDTTAVDLVARLVVPDLSVVRRWPGLVPAGAEGQGNLDLTLHGQLPLPETEVDLQASYRSPQLQVPAVTLRGNHANHRLHLLLDVPEGAALGPRRLDAASLDLKGDLTQYPDSAWADLRLRAATDTSFVNLTAAVSLARRGEGLPAMWARLDTLVARRGARSLGLASPSLLSLDPADSSLTVKGLRIEGRLGHVVADAWVRRDSLDVHLDVDVAVPLDEVRPFLSPQQQTTVPSGTAVLTGAVHLQGSPAAPNGHARLTVALRDVPRRPAVSLSGDLWLLAGDGTTIPDSAAAATPDDAPPRGLAADFELAVDDAPLLSVTARLPAAIALRPPSYAPLPGPARVVVVGEAIELSRLAALTPPDLNLAGRVDIAVTAAGDAKDLGLEGQIVARDLRIGLADGSWFRGEGDVTTGGTVRAPDLQGALVVERGLLLVPETPPRLLPADGDALLWTGRVRDDSLAVEADTMAIARAAAKDSVTAAATSKAAMRVTIPGGFWLRGRGLDLELKGDMWVHLEGVTTTVSGELSAVRGTFDLLGRNFTLERGVVILEGDVRELQPQLDILLVTELDGGRYWVKVTGTPTNMDLALTSSPEMAEGDIMATLLFGKSLDNLDDGQADLVAQRSVEIAAAYGAGRLQAMIADELGLDLVRIEPHTEDASATTLTVGKYLSPKVMVSYEQTLATVSTFVVHLEYLLKGGLKVHSAVSPGEESGAELLWSRDY
jgi:hypothetical protein